MSKKRATRKPAAKIPPAVRRGILNERTQASLDRRTAQLAASFRAGNAAKATNASMRR